LAILFFYDIIKKVTKENFLGEIMEERKTKKLELNTKKLENFDQIMATKLDEVEELKITDLDKNAELLNIISLCANIKTLIVEGDSRIHSDKILRNVFKPEILENLVLNGVKIPTESSLKRYLNLKMISLNGIHFCQVEKFLDGIANPESVEIINISDTDMTNKASKSLSRFTQLKYLKLEDLKNGKLEHLQFLTNNSNLLKIDFVHNPIVVTQLNYLLHSQCEKNIVAPILDSKGKAIENGNLKIQENKSELTLLLTDLEWIAKEVDLQKISKINVIRNEIEEAFDYIEYLKNLNAEVHILVNDFACLNVEEAKRIKKVLRRRNVEFVTEKGISKYKIDEYIKMRTEIEKAMESLPNQGSDAEKCLLLYHYFGKEFEIVKEDAVAEIENKICTVTQICQLLQNCLKCMNINSNMIVGKELENDKKHCWNQIELNGKWYNVDLALDLENIKKNKTAYCLLSDKEFFENHIPKSGKNNYCAENFNPKLIQVFFKTGLFKEKLLASYMLVMIQKIKKLLHLNKKQEVLALPEVITEEKEEE